MNQGPSLAGRHIFIYIVTWLTSVAETLFLVYSPFNPSPAESARVATVNYSSQKSLASS